MSIGDFDLRSPANDQIPQVVEPGPDSPCQHIAATTLFLTGIILDILRRHFSDPRRIVIPELRQLRWTEGEDTRLLIESMERWRPELTEHRPAILVREGEYRQSKLIMGAMHPPNLDGSLDHMVLWQGNHACVCLGASSGQARLLAHEVADELTQFGPLYRRQFHLQDWQVIGISSMAPLPEAERVRGITVSLGLGYQQLWSIHQQAVTLRKLTFLAQPHL